MRTNQSKPEQNERMVLVFGTICLDKVRRIERLPPAGGWSSVLDEQILLGGEAANTANALHLWGAEIELVGNVLGDDLDAKRLFELIEQKGLPTNRLEQAPATTPVCDVYVTPDGDRTMFGVGFETIGENAPLDKMPLTAGAWFTTDPNLKSAARKAYRRAIDAGMRAYVMDFLEPTDTFRPEDIWQCSTDWVSVRGNTQKNVLYVKKLIDKWGCFSILSDGPNGLIAGSPTLPVRHYPPYPTVSYVDSTGAGDMFRAGMLYGFEQDWPIQKCLQFASAAGCLKCQGLGATSYVPTVAEIEGHIQQNAEVSKHYL